MLDTEATCSFSDPTADSMSLSHFRKIATASRYDLGGAFSRASISKDCLSPAQ